MDEPYPGRGKQRPTPRLTLAQLNSELFLDTEVDVEWVVRRLRDTGLSSAQLETLMSHEVAPVLGGNVLSMSGVWGGFDLTPVEERFHAGRSRPTWCGRLALRMIRRDWAAVQARLQEGEEDT